MLVISVLTSLPVNWYLSLKRREELVPESIKVAGTSGRLRQKLQSFTASVLRQLASPLTFLLINVSFGSYFKISG